MYCLFFWLCVIWKLLLSLIDQECKVTSARWLDRRFLSSSSQRTPNWQSLTNKNTSQESKGPGKKFQHNIGEKKNLRLDTLKTVGGRVLLYSCQPPQGNTTQCQERSPCLQFSWLGTWECEHLASHCVGCWPRGSLLSCSIQDTEVLYMTGGQEGAGT